MIKKVIKNLKLVLNKKWEQIFLLFSSSLIIFLATRVPINPDEYLYSAIGNNMADSFKSGVCFSCIDSYHTFFVSLVLAFFNFITGIDSFIIYRIIIALFSIGSIFFLKKIFKVIFKKPKFPPVILLFLFPGFYYYSGMVLLDNVAFFFFTIFIYLIIKNDSYWKVGIFMALAFFTKEYYIIFCSFVVLVSILYDTLIKNRGRKVIWKIKFFLKNFTASFLFSFLLLLGIILFPIFPYTSLLGTFLLELLGGFYVKVGGYLNEVMYVDKGIVTNEIVKEVAEKNRNFKDVFVKNDLVNAVNRNSFLLLNNFSEGAFEYWRVIFREVYVNLYVLPLVVYGFYTTFRKNFFRELKKKQTIVMLSISLIFFLFFARTATTGGHGFRISFILIIPFIYFIYIAANNLLQNNKKYLEIFIISIISFIYISIQLLFIREVNLNSDIASSSSIFIQLFVKYKLFFDIIFYGLPIIIIISRLGNKKIILMVWLLTFFSYKITPVIINSYLIDQKSSVEYNLGNVKHLLSEIEEKLPIVLSNYERAYYYYSGSTNMPNNERKKLPIIRPKHPEIYEKRIVNINEKDFDQINKDFLCEKNIDYIFYVNKNYKNGIEQGFNNIQGIKVKRSFYEKETLNWIIYEFDNRLCKREN
jgi:hypothetical protein